MPLETLNLDKAATYNLRTVVERVNEIVELLNKIEKELKDAKNARARS